MLLISNRSYLPDPVFHSANTSTLPSAVEYKHDVRVCRRTACHASENMDLIDVSVPATVVE